MSNDVKTLQHFALFVTPLVGNCTQVTLIHPFTKFQWRCSCVFLTHLFSLHVKLFLGRSCSPPPDSSVSKLVHCSLTTSRFRRPVRVLRVQQMWNLITITSPCCLMTRKRRMCKPLFKPVCMRVSMYCAVNNHVHMHIRGNYV